MNSIIPGGGGCLERINDSRRSSRARAALQHPVFRPGITARLAIAFMAVALLAVAANLIVEHGVSIIQTTTVQAAPPPLSVKEIPLAPAPAAPVPVAAPAPIVLPARAELLLAAIVEFERAVERRGEASNGANAELMLAADKRGTAMVRRSFAIRTRAAAW
jgi:hypothetical protein